MVTVHHVAPPLGNRAPGLPPRGPQRPRTGGGVSARPTPASCSVRVRQLAQGRVTAPTVTWEHVKAHSGHPRNELVDSLAT
eukprot:12524771-Alexandrium_andersonii.AAC.1